MIYMLSNKALYCTSDLSCIYAPKREVGSTEVSKGIEIGNSCFLYFDSSTVTLGLISLRRFANEVVHNRRNIGGDITLNKVMSRQLGEGYYINYSYGKSLEYFSNQVLRMVKYERDFGDSLTNSYLRDIYKYPKDAKFFRIDFRSIDEFYFLGVKRVDGGVRLDTLSWEYKYIDIVEETKTDVILCSGISLSSFYLAFSNCSILKVFFNTYLKNNILGATISNNKLIIDNLVEHIEYEINQVFLEGVVKLRLAGYKGYDFERLVDLDDDDLLQK